MSMMYKILNINLTTVISDEPIADVPCKTCIKCCEELIPYLSPEEMESGLYPLSLIQPSQAEIDNTPEIGPIITVYRKNSGGCGMLVNNKCSIYEYRPKSCRQFDCRKGHHPKIPNMVT